MPRPATRLVSRFAAKRLSTEWLIVVSNIPARRPLEFANAARSLRPPWASGRVWMALAWQGFRDLPACGWLRPCIRRRSCGVRAARPDEGPRGLGPNQWPALAWRSGPDGVSRSCCPSVCNRRTLRLTISSDRLGPCSFLSRAKPDSSRRS
jgi:hypothetical protein